MFLTGSRRVLAVSPVDEEGVGHRWSNRRAGNSQHGQKSDSDDAQIGEHGILRLLGTRSKWRGFR